MTIDELVDNFGLFDDWEERYRYLIDLGAKLPPMPEGLKTEQNKVRGCISQVWITLAWNTERRLAMLVDSDAQIVRGLAAVLCIIFQEKNADEIREINVTEIFKKLGLDEHLTPNRRNGFFSMVERVRAFIS